MLTTKMRFYSDLANYPRSPVGSIFSFAPANGVLSLRGCEPMTEGTWAEGTMAEGNWFVKDQGPWRRGCCRFLAYSRLGTLKRFSIFKVPPRWDFPALSPESLPFSPSFAPRPGLVAPFARSSFRARSIRSPAKSIHSPQNPLGNFRYSLSHRSQLIRCGVPQTVGVFLSRTASRRGEGLQYSRACELGNPMGTDRPSQLRGAAAMKPACRLRCLLQIPPGLGAKN